LKDNSEFALHIMWQQIGMTSTKKQPAMLHCVSSGLWNENTSIPNCATSLAS